MSSPDWSRYMHDVLGAPDPPKEISAEVVYPLRLEALYRERLPLVPGARPGRAADRRAVAAGNRLFVE